MSDKPDEEVRSLLLEHEDKPEVVEDALLEPVEEEVELVQPEPEPPYEEPPLTQAELVELRWILFGICPECHANVKDWHPGPFNAARYQAWQDKGIDPLSGHMKTCYEKWRRH